LEFYYPEKFIQRGEEEALRLLPVLKQMTGALDLSGGQTISQTVQESI
ncbi:MAG: hypothetical protein HY595_04010, partial [Candidatus Omnitrophica bacterium]|nr:hypothetical protein [Candidatus Omnitrophota bacterium]